MNSSYKEKVHNWTYFNAQNHLHLGASHFSLSLSLSLSLSISLSPSLSISSPTDVDECKETAGLCKYGKCVNNHGSFACQCQKGFGGDRCQRGTLTMNFSWFLSSIKQSFFSSAQGSADIPRQMCVFKRTIFCICPPPPNQMNKHCTQKPCFKSHTWIYCLAQRQSFHFALFERRDSLILWGYLPGIRLSFPDRRQKHPLDYFPRHILTSAAPRSICRFRRGKNLFQNIRQRWGGIGGETFRPLRGFFSLRRRLKKPLRGRNVSPPIPSIYRLGK